MPRDGDRSKIHQSIANLISEMKHRSDGSIWYHTNVNSECHIICEGLIACGDDDLGWIFNQDEDKSNPDLSARWRLFALLGDIAIVWLTIEGSSESYKGTWFVTLMKTAENAWNIGSLAYVTGPGEMIQETDESMIDADPEE